MSELLKSFLSGWAGGVGILAVGHPFDTVKTRLQADNTGRYKGPLDVVRQSVKAEGPLALYKGVTAPFWGVGVVFALYFVAYDVAERTLRSIYGIAPEKSLNLMQVMVCGANTGVVGSLLLGPSELIKTRQQTASMKGLDSSFGGVIKSIRAEAGMRGFTKGLGATMMRDVPGSMAWFGAYEMAKQTLCTDPKRPTVVQALTAGGCGGLGMWSVAFPMDTIKTRVQASTSGERQSFFGVGARIMKESGIRGFYRGFAPMAIRAFPANAACFAMRESCQSFLDTLF